MMDDKTLVLVAANCLVKQRIARADSRVVDRLASIHMHLADGLRSRAPAPRDPPIGTDAAFLLCAADMLRDSPVYAAQLRSCAGGLVRGWVSA